MARADLLKQLFRAYRGGDHSQFMDAAMGIVDEERRKQHTTLARDLTRILNNGSNGPAATAAVTLSPLPKDDDRGTSLLDVRHPERYPQDVVLPEAQRRLVTDVMDEFRDWDVLEANGLRPSSTLLFCGPPGCGKTITAEMIATELSLPMLYVRFDAVVSSLLGETAANLRKIFDYAARDMWVLFFDEFDAIGRSRDDATEHGELKRVVNAFLQLLDAFTGRSLVIAATNFPQSLDLALWRRFDEVIRFEKPDIEAIARLIDRRTAHMKRSFKPAAFAEQLDGMSYSDVERICWDALKKAAMARSRTLSGDQFEAAIRKQRQRDQAVAMGRPHGDPTVDEA